VEEVSMSRADKRLQMLRGARLALQHYKDFVRKLPTADVVFLLDIHLTEYRRLPFLARKAYDRWEPHSDLRERVCR
jgi:hypothetical protein